MHDMPCWNELSKFQLIESLHIRNTRCTRSGNEAKAYTVKRWSYSRVSWIPGSVLQWGYSWMYTTYGTKRRAGAAAMLYIRVRKSGAVKVTAKGGEDREGKARTKLPTRRTL